VHGRRLLFRVYPVDCNRRDRKDRTVPITVLIVDDHATFRTLARRMLEAQGYEVVGEADSGAGALAAAARLQPGAVLLDIQLPDLDGFAVTEQLSRGEHPPMVVLVSSRDASAYRRRLGDSPARGFLAKSELTGAAFATLVA
jgi:DNA-binding NarL/FixJ family response regulator